MRNRFDGERIRDLDGFHSIVPYVMPKRTEAEISSEERFDVTDLLAYLRRRNEEEGTKLKLFHAFCQDHGMLHTPDACFAYLRAFPERYRQTSFFDL